MSYGGTISVLLPIMLGISKASYETEWFHRNRPVCANNKRSNFICCLIYISIIKLTRSSYLPIFTIFFKPRYRNVYQEQFMIDLVPKCHIRAITLEALVNKDYRIPHELQLLVLCYRQWWMTVPLQCVLASYFLYSSQCIPGTTFSYHLCSFFCARWIQQLTFCYTFSVALLQSPNEGKSILLSIEHLVTFVPKALRPTYYPFLKKPVSKTVS